MAANPDANLEEPIPEYTEQVGALLTEVQKKAEDNPYLKHLMEQSGW